MNVECVVLMHNIMSRGTMDCNRGVIYIKLVKFNIECKINIILVVSNYRSSSKHHAIDNAMFKTEPCWHTTHRHIRAPTAHTHPRMQPTILTAWGSCLLTTGRQLGPRQGTLPDISATALYARENMLCNVGRFKNWQSNNMNNSYYCIIWCILWN